MNTKNLDFIETFLEKDYISLKESLEKLLKDYRRKENRLNTIIHQSDKQQQSLLLLNEELDSYKNELELKVEEEIKKRKEKEKILLQQSKLAAMGEMMDAVAHQWKQPINIIKMKIDMIGYDFDDNLIDKEYIEDFQKNIFQHIDHMTNTLNEFRTFFRNKGNMEDFSVLKMIEKVLFLVKDEFMQHTITLNLKEKNDFLLHGVENEFKHLILNIINNSKDAFIEKKCVERIINISVSENEEAKFIEISDNAGGIPTDVIDDIFKANVTTKEEGKGTGIGLYMSQQIANKHNGLLTAQNISDGALFIFKQLK